MTKLTYTNDQQFVNDAAQALLKAHLSWSGSHEGMPSKDHDNIGNQMGRAYLKAHFSCEEWAEMSEQSQKLVEAQAQSLYKQAKQLADKKWEAAMLLLNL